MHICVPSYNRAGRVTVTGWLPMATVICCASQEKDYRKYHENVLVIPDSEDGHISKKRNAVLNRVDDDIFMIDDDVKGFKRIHGGMLTPEESYHFILQGFLLMHDIGAGYWGLNVTTDPMKAPQYAPFSLTKPFWQAVGIKRDNLRYDERLGNFDDGEFWLQKIHKYRKVVRFNLYALAFSKSTIGGTVGGWEGRKAKERAAEQIVLKKWGSKVVTFEQVETFYDTPHFTLPIKGI